jgi:hypothetical protein
MTRQVVITRREDGGFRVIEMGLGTSGMGETLREHVLQPEINAEMATRYLVRVLEGLIAA